MQRRVLVLVSLLALVAPAVARADAPPNDARAAATVVPSFPATLQGTTTGASVERLDPQTGRCGAVESTVWYRIDQAPDGLVKLTVQGAGLAPAVRVYRAGRSAISEVTCANAGAGAAASTTFESVRGASFLVMVGKRPGTADGDFTLQAQLFLPPANDDRADARRVPRSGTVTGTTVGATSDDADSAACGVATSTVWYRFDTPADGRLAVRLTAAGKLDTSLVVLHVVRSKTELVGCAQTGSNGRGLTTFDVVKGGRYLVEVGQQRGSAQGGFSFQLIAAQARELVAKQTLRNGVAHGTVHGLADVNDLYAVTLDSGTTYRIAFRAAQPCPELSLVTPLRRPALQLQCDTYTTYTPGPDAGGRYVLDVEAAPDAQTQPYTIRVAAAQPDDVGIGVPLANRVPKHGTLSPRGVDMVDIYHFDLERTSDVRLRLASSSFQLVLLTDGGERLRQSAAGTIAARLGAGRFVVAVQAQPGEAGSRYTLSLLVRDLTSTALTISGKTTATIELGQSVTFAATTTPSTATGTDKVEIDRFDPLTGWHFVRLIDVRAPNGSLTWTPPTAGRWRARVDYRGSLTASPSRSGYVFVDVE
jgi:hypothetical protein